MAKEAKSNTEKKKPSAYEVFKGLKSNALSYEYVNSEKESGSIKEADLRGYAAQIAPDEVINAYLQDRKTPIQETYPFIEAGYKRFTRLSDEMGDGKLEEIVDSTPKKNLKLGLDYIRPDPKNAGKFTDAAEYHKNYLEMNDVLAVYQDEDAEDEVREKAAEKMLKKVKSHYDKELSKDEPEVKEAVKWLIENSQIFALNSYAMMYKEMAHKFNEEIKGKEKDYIKAIIENDKDNRERFYQAIIQEPKKKKDKD